MEILDDPENADVLSWLHHGRGFVIYRKKAFEQRLLPKYFSKQSKYSSFTRKLNRWGFSRVTRGPEGKVLERKGVFTAATTSSLFGSLDALSCLQLARTTTSSFREGGIDLSCR
jgi:HSF-type DNA-binding